MQSRFSTTIDYSLAPVRKRAGNVRSFYDFKPVSARERGNKQLLSCLHYCTTDVLDLDSMLETLNSIDTHMPHALHHRKAAGLLLYFTNHELRLFLENIFTLLSRGRNATWISDLVTQENLEELFSSHPGVARSVRKVFELTGRTIIASNPFQSEARVQRYLSEFGLRVNSMVPLRGVTTRLDLDVSIDSRLREGIVGTRKVWTVSARK